MSVQINKNGKLAISPGLTPYVLVQVLDLSAGAKTVKTVIPNGRGWIGFHRALPGVQDMDDVHWSVGSQDGFVTLIFTSNSMSTGCRVYLFSDFVVNTPNWGLFIYKKGEIIYHSSCLPLKMKFLNPNDSAEKMPRSKTTTYAVMSCVTECWDGTLASTQDIWGYSHISAGWGTNNWQIEKQYTITGAVPYLTNRKPTGEPDWPAPIFNVETVGYIETNIYDQYYKAALGY